MKDYKKTDLLISIVNHNKGSEVKSLLDCIEKYCVIPPAVVITQNIKEKLPFTETDYSFFIKIINNRRAKGFGANHNKAFKYIESEYFCVLNTDLYFSEDPFSYLINNTDDRDVGVMAPIVFNRNNQLADNARKLPTPWTLLRRRFIKKNDYLPSKTICYVDWIAGFFMLFDSETFKRLNGFNEEYYLYCEDVDICSRIWLIGKKVAWNAGVAIYHDAQRSSHSQLYFFLQHVRSLLRLFCSKSYYSRVYQKLIYKI